jgi:hypothetical protein
MSGQLHAQAALQPAEEPPVPSGYEGGERRTGLDDVEKRKFLTLPVLKLRPLGSPYRSQSPYRLLYPGFL